ncbi:DUF427 domain-containing protein [Streptomyces sp. MUM 203J]|uniref:DUF427 domain-containing protein n=1 Tax=Streptomyces sp. MUM 203J TaxID=2791990 RepID=UPI001F033A4A|nr:DUF427 domain-containing protein [Streptomyces sp. MUM 203J]MCH0541714.1 DUF427 domain-containing protein [Streptomyces sp. MUM 203J]
MAAMRVVRRPELPGDAVLWEPSERWVRGTRAGVTVVDSRRPVLVWEPDRPVPLYAFPPDDVRMDLLRPAERPPAGRHARAAGFHDLVMGVDTVPNAAWSLPDDDAAVGGYLVFAWFGRSVLDHWYEEETEIFVHPRDPHKRVDALPSSRHVRVEIEGITAAESRAPVVLFETGLPERYYLPRDAVRFELLAPTGHRTRCPYKGVASDYWSWTGPGRVPPHLAWSYPDPLPAVEVITGMVAFCNEFVDLTVDGERLERPVTHFSRLAGGGPAPRQS